MSYTQLGTLEQGQSFRLTSKAKLTVTENKNEKVVNLTPAGMPNSIKVIRQNAKSTTVTYTQRGQVVVGRFVHQGNPDMTVEIRQSRKSSQAEPASVSNESSDRTASPRPRARKAAPIQ